MRACENTSLRAKRSNPERMDCFGKSALAMTAAPCSPHFKSIAARILLWCAFAVLLILGFMEAGAISRFNGASLRFNTPINGDTAYRARQYSINNIEQIPFWPTFWREDRTTLAAGARTAQADSISFSGDAALVWPGEFLTGSAPSSIDIRGIAVSVPLAHSLWGSTDIIGMHVYVNEKPRIVWGVFEGAAEFALISYHIEDTSQYWTAVELSGGTPNPTRNVAETFALMSGLGRPDYVLMGGAMALARFMALFPILIPAVYLLTLLVGFIKKYYPSAFTPMIFAGFILLAVLLPILLNALPPWIIPTHWSDFSFWSQLSRQVNTGIREFLSVPPMLRDIELRIHLLRQTGLLVLSICCGIVVCARATGVKGFSVLDLYGFEMQGLSPCLMNNKEPHPQQNNNKPSKEEPIAAHTARQGQFKAWPVADIVHGIVDIGP